MPGDSLYITFKDSTYAIVRGGAIPQQVLDSLPPENRQMVLDFLTQEITVENPDMEPNLLWLLAVLVMLLSFLKISRMIRPGPHTTPAQDMPIHNPSFQTFQGSSLSFDDRLLNGILIKYFSYYKALAASEKERFIQRLQNFIQEKTFTVPASEAYQEMPVLTSAAAIQLGFGLPEYLLPWFQHIVVHPKEYIAVNPLRVLAGNVSGNTIALSWKHFLEGYQQAEGVNVGLHEMAHALQRQHEHFFKMKGKKFRREFDLFESMKAKVRQQEKSGGQPLFTQYALSSTDEFWASSVELFFERPTVFCQHYPQVYAAIRSLLRQDPAKSGKYPCC